jgi:cytidine deaminase
MLSNAAKQRLYEQAVDVAKNSYCPYSNYAVGSAVLTAGGSVYVGTNVENAAYGLTVCAEQVAVCNAVSHGDRQIIAIAIYATHGPVRPCGGCRQFIAEFGSDIEVIYMRDGSLVSHLSAGLLPDGFSGKDLSHA